VLVGKESGLEGRKKLKGGKTANRKGGKNSKETTRTTKENPRVRGKRIGLVKTPGEERGECSRRRKVKGGKSGLGGKKRKWQRSWHTRGLNCRKM